MRDTNEESNEEPKDLIRSEKQERGEALLIPTCQTESHCD
jgi:hypothetical protein